MTWILVLSISVLVQPDVQQGAWTPERIIDMHQHALPADFWGSEDPEWFDMTPPAADSQEELIEETREAMDRFNIVQAVFSGSRELVDRWYGLMPGRVLRGSNLAGPGSEQTVALLRELHGPAGYEVMGEISWQFAGLSPADPSVEPYFKVAQETGVPMGIHMGPAPPGASEWSGFRAKLGRPLLLEEMLTKYPSVPVYVMHAGWPFIDEMIAVMQLHPQVYVDISLINWFIPREAFYDALKQMVDAGLEDRIMFGSDAGVWPGAIRIAVETVAEAPFLDETQKRKIFYGNALKFLELDTGK